MGLAAVEVVLSQDGHSCPLTARFETYNVNSSNGLVELSQVLERGVTPAVSYWSSSQMFWLDGIGADGKGPCVKDSPEACPASVTFYGFKVDDIHAHREPNHNQQYETSSAHSEPSPFEPVLDTIHGHLLRQGNALKEEELANVTEDCYPNCEGTYIEVPNGSNRSNTSRHANDSNQEAGDLYLERRGGRSEWEIMSSTADVRSGKNLSAKVLKKSC